MSPTRIHVIQRHILPALELSKQNSDCFLLGSHVSSVDPTIVITQQGPIRGVRSASGGIAFKGVPFAAPPVGELRFRKPVPHQSWKETLDCGEFRACAIQAENRDHSLRGGMDESCLYLNIWTPPPSSMQDRQLRPVAVWFHSGGFDNGSASESHYDGERLATDGIVVVTVNYRLGVFGFLVHEGADANCGLWDLVFGLQWIRDNIALFGGDPNQVTIGGDSAGATCVVCLIASPVTKGLFQRAVANSSNGGKVLDWHTAKMLGAQFARAAGVASQGIEGLRQLSAQELFDTQVQKRTSTPTESIVVTSQMSLGYGSSEGSCHLSPVFDPADQGGIHYIMPPGSIVQKNSFWWGFPVVDGELLPAQPLDLLASGAAKHIALLVGSNREEVAFLPDPKDPERSAKFSYGDHVGTLQQAQAVCERKLMGFGKLKVLGGARLVAERLVEAYAAAEGGLGDGRGGIAPKGSAQHVWDRLGSDMSYGAPTIMVAVRHSWHTPYTWVFRYEGFKGRSAIHCWHIPLLFSHLRPKQANNPQVVAFSESFRRSVSSFILHGDPNGAPGVPPWPRWNESMSRGQLPEIDDFVMQFDLSHISCGRCAQIAPAITEAIRLIDDVYFHSSKTFNVD